MTMVTVFYFENPSAIRSHHSPECVNPQEKIEQINILFNPI